MFSGSIPALVTPFRDGAFDESAFRKLVEWQIENGSSALVPCGTTGEASTLSNAEHHRVIEVCIEQAAGRVPIIAGCGSNDTMNARLHLNFSKKSGAKAGLCVAPYYNRPSQAGLIAHFSFRREARAVLPGNRRFRRVRHRPAAPGFARLVGGIAATQRGQCQRELGARRVGHRGETVKKGHGTRGRFGGIGQQTLSRYAHLRLIGEARIGQQEPGIVVKCRAAAARQHFPPLDRGGDRSGLAGDKLCPRAVPFAAVLALRRGGERDQSQQAKRGNLSRHAGHMREMLLIRP